MSFRRLNVFLLFQNLHVFTLLRTNISPFKGIMKMIFLCPRWDLLVPWMVVPWPPTRASRETQLSQDELLAKARAQMRFTRDSEELPLDFLNAWRVHTSRENEHVPWKSIVGRFISYWNSPLLREHVSCRGCHIKKTWWYMKGGRMNGGILRRYS